MAIFVFLEAKLVILGPIDFLLGFPINLNVNAGKNKFEVDIIKNVAKITNVRPYNWHNSVIFRPILTFFSNCLFFETNRMMTISKPPISQNQIFQNYRPKHPPLKRKTFLKQSKQLAFMISM